MEASASVVPDRQRQYGAEERELFVTTSTTEAFGFIVAPQNSGFYTVQVCHLRRESAARCPLILRA